MNNILKTLADSVERLAGHDYAVRTGLTPGDGELGRLVRTVDQMAQNLEDCEHERERTYQALVASEVRYRRLFEAAQEGILIVDADTGQIEDVNPFLSQMLGYTREQWLGKKIWEVAPFDSVDSSLADLRRLGAEEFFAFEELMLTTRDGRSVSVEFASSSYLVNEQRVVQCYLRDISKRKAAEKSRNEYSRKLQALSHKLVRAQESERRHLALELHDEIGQALTVAQINLQHLSERLDSAEAQPRAIESLAAVNRVLEQVRNMALNLRPSMLDDLGLEAALRWYAKRLATSVGLKCEMIIDPLEQRLDPIVETECFRVAQESLTNVVRHAKARHVKVELRREEGQLHLRVQDDGAGFDVAAVRERAALGNSLGLLSMEERASLAGGSLEFKSTPGNGSEVNAWFPLRWASQVISSEHELLPSRKLAVAA